jgi:CBS domain containing-hemolysin-like protein
MIEVLLILAALALVAACGAFVAAEFAFVTVDRPTAEREAARGDTRARGVVDALHTLSTQLSAAQVGITLTNLLIGFLAEPSVARLIDGPLESVGLSADTAGGVALVLAIALATGVTMVFGELVPKNLAIAKPLATARAVQGFLRGFTRSTAIIVRFFNGTANSILRRVGVEPQEELASARSPEELSSLVRRSAEHGTLAEDTATLLERSLSFGERRAADVMVPRGRVRTLRAAEPVRAVLLEARASGRSRFPVLDPDGENVVGMVHVKHAMSIAHEQRDHVPVRDVMVEPVLVPASLELDPLLATLRGGGLQMGVVVDEWGNVDGIVTLEDLIEEIVGDVRDEYDPRDDSFRRLGECTWNLSGLLRPDEVAAVTGIVLPEDDEYETIAGLVTVRLERVPELGDRVEIEAVDRDGARHRVDLRVVLLEGHRVDRIRMRHEPVPADIEDDG